MSSIKATIEQIKRRLAEKAEKKSSGHVCLHFTYPVGPGETPSDDGGGPCPRCGEPLWSPRFVDADGRDLPNETDSASST
jgi:hypothetical protein